MELIKTPMMDIIYDLDLLESSYTNNFTQKWMKFLDTLTAYNFQEHFKNETEKSEDGLRVKNNKEFPKLNYTKFFNKMESFFSIFDKYVFEGKGPECPEAKIMLETTLTSYLMDFGSEFSLSKIKSSEEKFNLVRELVILFFKLLKDKI